MASSTDRKRETGPQRDRLHAILDRAERSFAEQGYAATSMSAIAAELGYSKTTLWSRFRDKESLFAAVLDRRVDGFTAAMDEALVPAGGARATLDRFAGVYLEKVLSPETRRLRRLVMAEGHRFPDLVQSFFERGPIRTRERLARHMANEMAAGRLREGDAELAAKQFLALTLARSATQLMWFEPDQAIAVTAHEVAEAVDSFLRAWGPPQSPPSPAQA